MSDEAKTRLANVLVKLGNLDNRVGVAVRCAANVGTLRQDDTAALDDVKKLVAEFYPILRDITKALED